MLDAVLINLLSQALWEFSLSPIIRSVGGLLQPQEPDPHESPFAIYAAQAARAIESLQLHRCTAPLAELLDSAEVRGILRNLYVFNIGTQPDGVAVAGAAFASYWAQVCPSHSDAADSVFTALADAADAVLAKAIADGSLLAHDTRDTLRQRLLADHLRAIERKVDLLRGPTFSLSAVFEFESRYRAEVAERAGFITPPDFQRAPRVPLDDLYVLPTLDSRGPDGSIVSTDYAEWLQRLDRGVVLGNPGAGKSTLAKKLAFNLASDTSRGTLAGRFVTPAIVVLKDYAAEKRTRGHSIREFLEAVAHASYQLDPPDGAFEYLLTSGSLLIVFDGLDELLDTSYRQEIRSDVESFARRYPLTPIVVTSREVGYDQAPLSPETFELVHVAEFADSQVEEYARKWFLLDDELEPTEREEKAAAFIAESALVPDLRSNPLLLALMCNLYRGQNYLPRKRPDVYEQCANMLFEVWDKSRGIESVLPIAEHLRPAMQDLAFWIYSNEDLRSGVTREQLIERSTEFLVRWRFDDVHRARHAAAEFVDFSRGRAWVFSDLGSTATGEDLFQFTHQTFLEYFTAGHLVSIANSTADLADALAPRIAKAEWDVVAQLAFQLASRGRLGAADELLERLLGYSSNGQSHNTLRFAARSLAFLVPTPAMVRRVVETAIDTAAAQAATITGIGPLNFGSGRWPGDLIMELSRMNPEVAETGDEVIVSRLDELLSGSPDVAAGAARIIVGTSVFAPQIVPSTLRSQLASLQSRRRERLRSLAERDMPLAVDLVARNLEASGAGSMSISELLQLHGGDALFVARPILGSTGPSWYGPIAFDLANTFDVTGPGESHDERHERLEEVGRYASGATLPWVRVQIEWLPLRLTNRDNSVFEYEDAPLSDLAFLGLFSIVASAVELSAGNKRTETNSREMLAIDSQVWQVLGRVTAAWEARSDVPLNWEGVPQTAQPLIKQWIQREIRFTEAAPPGDSDILPSPGSVATR